MNVFREVVRFDCKLDPNGEVILQSKYRAKRLVVRLDGRDYVMAPIGFSADLVTPDGSQHRLSWDQPVHAGGVYWTGGIVHGGVIEVTVRGVAP